MAKVTLSNFEKAVSDMLEEYVDDIERNVDLATENVGKLGVKALRSESRSKFKGTGKYAKSWTSTTFNDRTGANKIVIHNKHYSLPHLLENGHAKRGGGRVEGRAHIAPVEKEMIEQFEKQIKEAIQK